MLNRLLIITIKGPRTTLPAVQGEEGRCQHVWIPKLSHVDRAYIAMWFSSFREYWPPPSLMFSSITIGVLTRESVTYLRRFLPYKIGHPPSIFLAFHNKGPINLLPYFVLLDVKTFPSSSHSFSAMAKNPDPYGMRQVCKSLSIHIHVLEFFLAFFIRH